MCVFTVELVLALESILIYAYRSTGGFELEKQHSHVKYNFLFVCSMYHVFYMSSAARRPAFKRACLCLGWRSLNTYAPVLADFPNRTRSQIRQSLSMCVHEHRPPCSRRRSPHVERCMHVLFCCFCLAHLEEAVRDRACF